MFTLPMDLVNSQMAVMYVRAEFSPAGVQVADFEVAAEVKALALDPHGRLGVIQGAGGPGCDL